jgi:hypothetical protein
MLFLFVCLLSNRFWFRIFHGPVGIYCVFRINALSSVCLVSVVVGGCCLLFGHCIMLSRRCLWKCLWRSYEILSFVLKFIWCLVNWVLMLNFMFVKFESFVSFRRILDMENEMLSAEHVWICGGVNKKIILVLVISLSYP